MPKTSISSRVANARREVDSLREGCVSDALLSFTGPHWYWIVLTQSRKLLNVERLVSKLST